MFKKYLIKFNIDFLDVCSICNIRDIILDKNTCCICKDKYCNKCKFKLYELTSFFKSKYCCECYNYATNSEFNIFK